MIIKSNIRDKINFDIVIVGAGPSGLSLAIHIKQLAYISNKEISVCIIEKGSSIGSHIISGAIINPISISELFPNWKKLGAPLKIKVNQEKILFLKKNIFYKIPNYIVPNSLKNNNNYIISLANLVRWLGKQAEILGVEIFSGFSAIDILFNKDKSVKGIITGDLGINKNNIPTKNFQPGIELHAKYTFFAEGARGNLGKKLIKKFNLNKNKDSQKFSIGIKEIWDVSPDFYKPGLVIHTFGWPLKSDIYGGSFLYHMDNQQISVGYIINLSYKNPYISPYEEFQKYKTHPIIKKFLRKGKRISYGAKVINIGGLQSIPNLIFPGGMLIGCNAGFLNSSSIKGIHTSIKSGILAAKSVYEALKKFRKHDKLIFFNKLFKKSWLYKELYKSKNFNILIKKGFIGKILANIDQKIFKGNIPFILKQKKEDFKYLKPALKYKPIRYLKYDGELTFSKSSSVFISNTNHIENQPLHLIVNNYKIQEIINFNIYNKIEERYCPADVYKFIKYKNINKLKINIQNCLHCKTCDIKDPNQNITWVPPEGGGGPNYTNM